MVKSAGLARPDVGTRVPGMLEIRIVGLPERILRSMVYVLLS